jgi:hypothetical protein
MVLDVVTIGVVVETNQFCIIIFLEMINTIDLELARVMHVSITPLPGSLE